MENSKTTMDTELEDVLKDDIMQDIILEADGKVVKVYGKIAGLNCVGRTFFATEAEIAVKNKWAQAQMMQKYGAEVYGASAQLQTQKANEAEDSLASGTGSGRAEVSSLITCKVNKLMELPAEFVESGGTGKDFQAALQELEDFMKERDKMWINKHASEIRTFADAKKKLNANSGASGNQETWTVLQKLFNDTWKTLLENDKDLLEKVNKVRKSWQEWAKSSTSGDSSGNPLGSSGLSDKSDEWNPRQTYRIDIQTNFDDTWFKRKFKSGLLNKAIMMIKTDARSHSSGFKTDMTGHKYTADEMLPQDKKKLDGIQWKMTNKVAKDYVTYLLGWSRPKEMNDTDGLPSNELKQDQGFGKKMADKALSGRGIFGRLMQKVFAGQKSNNVISVAFQLADPNDGWKVKKVKGNEKDLEEDQGQGDQEQEPEPKEQQNDKEQANESTCDPFSDLFADEERRRVVRLVCEGRADVDQLIDTCLLESLDE